MAKGYSVDCETTWLVVLKYVYIPYIDLFYAVLLLECFAIRVLFSIVCYWQGFNLKEGIYDGYYMPSLYLQIYYFEAKWTSIFQLMKFCAVALWICIQRECNKGFEFDCSSQVEIYCFL